MELNGRFGRLIHSTWGALFALGAAMVVGGAAVAWWSGLTTVPGDVEILKARVAVNADSIAIVSKRAVWIICTSVPPNRRDVLAAMEIDCRYVSDLPALNTRTEEFEAP